MIGNKAFPFPSGVQATIVRDDKPSANALLPSRNYSRENRIRRDFLSGAADVQVSAGP
jgi:hypothetical protein